MKRYAAALVGGVAAMVASSVCRAQVMADQVPGDAIMYFGWAGGDVVQSKYTDTHLHAVLSESRVNEVFTTYFDQLEKHIGKIEADAVGPFKMFRSLTSSLWKFPTAIYMAKPDLTDQQMPHFTVAILSKAGDKADAIAADLNRMIPRQGGGGPAPKIFARDGLLTVLLSTERSDTLDLSKGTLLAAPTFASALGQVKKDAVITTYVDYQGLVSAIEGGLNVHEPEGAKKAKAFLDASGLRGVKQLISTGTFEGKDWAAELFLATDSKREGLLKALPSGGVDADLLKVVPADATVMRTFHFDPAVLTSELRNTLKATDEEAVEQYNQVFGILQGALGTDIESGLLEPLGKDWVIYGAPEVGSGGALGLVLVNKLDDPAAAQKGLSTVSNNVVNWANVGIQQLKPPFPVKLHGATAKIGGVEVNYLASPLLAPSWAIDDGKLYIGFYPQTVGSAIRFAKKGKPSIVESEKYVNALKTLKQDKFDCVGFYDLPTSAKYGSMYTTLLAVGRYMGIADLFGPTLPEPLLPPIDVVLDHLAPAADGTWSDEAGLHHRSIMSFPGAVLFNEQTAALSMGIGTVAMFAGSAVPQFHQAQENSARMRSQSNLRQIGIAMMLHANENNGTYPATFAPLLTGQELTIDVFDSPRNGAFELPDDILNDPEALAQFAVDHSDYIYVGAGLTNQAPGDTVLAYENPEGMEEGICILFGDGHVEYQLIEDAMQLIGQLKKPGI